MVSDISELRHVCLFLGEIMYSLCVSENEPAYVRWLLMRALQKQLQVFSEMFQIRSFSVFLSIGVPIIYSEGINFD